MGKHPDVVQDAWQYLLVTKKLMLGQSLDTFESFHLVKTPVYIGFLRSVFAFTGLSSETSMITGVQVAQVFLYALNIWLIHRCTVLLTNSRVTGLIAGVVGILYLPLLFYTDRVLTETVMISLLLASTWCYLSGKKWWCALYLFLGLATSLMTLWIKVLFAFIAVAAYWGLGFLFQKESDVREKLNKSCWQLTQILLVVTGLYLITKPVVFGWYQGESTGQSLLRFADTQGWSPTVPFNGFYQEIYLFETPVFTTLRQLLSEEISLLVSWVIYEPWEFISRYVVNIVRFFSRPSNPFMQSWLGLPSWFVLQLHLAIRVLCLMGLPVIFIRGRLNPLLVLSVVWAGCYSLHHIEARYNLPMMPLLIITAVTIFHWVWVECKEKVDVLGFMSMGLIALNFIVNPVGSIFPISRGDFLVLPDMAWLFHIFAILFWHNCLMFGSAKLFLEPSSKQINFLNLKISIEKIKSIDSFKPKVSLNQLIYIFALSVAGFFYIQFFANPVVYPRYDTLKTNETISQKIVIAASQKKDLLDNLKTATDTDYETYVLLEARTSGLKQSGQALEVRAGESVLQEVPVSGFLNVFEGLMAGYNEPVDFPQYRFYKVDETLLENTLTDGEENLIISVENHDREELLVPFDYPRFYSGDYVIPDFDWGRFSRFKALYDRDGRLPRAIQSSDTGKKYRILLLRFPKDPNNTLTPRPNFTIEEGQLVKEIYVLY